jgi:hypothetical protein
MNCIHELVPETCAWESDGDDLYGVMTIDRPVDYSDVELDESLWVDLSLDGHTYTVSVQRASESSDNPCPSEAGFQSALEDAAWERQEACYACQYEADGFGQVYDDHLCDLLDVDTAGLRLRPLATEFPKPEVVGRPAWCRVEFTGGNAGAHGVELLDPLRKMEAAGLSVTPIEWDEPIELVATDQLPMMRLRWELSEQRQHRTSRMQDCACPHDLGDCDSHGDCPCIICHVGWGVRQVLASR